MNVDMARSFARAMFEDALAEARCKAPGLPMVAWSLQGFGMLRRHLPDDWRLNVWDSRHRVKNVSLIHDHPWHFESLVVSGRLVNRRFKVFEPGKGYAGDLMCRQELRPGPGGGLLSTPDVVVLAPEEPEAFRRGDVYSQRRQEVHRSDPEDGCVTLNRRYERDGGDVAHVFWPYAESWVSAEPRQATAGEVADVLARALAGWDR